LLRGLVFKTEVKLLVLHRDDGDPIIEKVNSEQIQDDLDDVVLGQEKILPPVEALVEEFEHNQNQIRSLYEVI
jgi:hypothetical protein